MSGDFLESIVCSADEFQGKSVAVREKATLERRPHLNFRFLSGLVTEVQQAQIFDVHGIVVILLLLLLSFMSIALSDYKKAPLTVREESEMFCHPYIGVDRLCCCCCCLGIAPRA